MLLNDKGVLTDKGQIAVKELTLFLEDFIYKYLAQGAKPQDICHIIATRANYIASYKQQLQLFNKETNK